MSRQQDNCGCLGTRPIWSTDQPTFVCRCSLRIPLQITAPSEVVAKIDASRFSNANLRPTATYAISSHTSFAAKCHWHDRCFNTRSLTMLARGPLTTFCRMVCLPLAIRFRHVEIGASEALFIALLQVAAGFQMSGCKLPDSSRSL